MDILVNATAWPILGNLHDRSVLPIFAAVRLGDYWDLERLRGLRDLVVAADHVDGWLGKKADTLELACDTFIGVAYYTANDMDVIHSVRDALNNEEANRLLDDNDLTAALEHWTDDKYSVLPTFLRLPETNWACSEGELRGLCSCDQIRRLHVNADGFWISLQSFEDGIEAHTQLLRWRLLDELEATK